MTLLVLILLAVLQVILPMALFGVGLMITQFRFPLVGFIALLNIADAVVTAAQFWWLFGIWHQTFVLGSIAISAAVLVLSLIVLVATNLVSREKNVRINVSFSLLFGRVNAFFQVVSMLVMVIWIVVLYKTYALSIGPITDATIRSATFLFFTGISLPLFAAAAVQMAGNALKSSLDPAVRNVVALTSLGGYSLAAWRAALPFLYYAGPVVVMGYAVHLSGMLAVLVVIFALFVVVPLFLGDRRYVREHGSVINEAIGILDDVVQLRQPDLDGSIFAQERARLSQRINEMLVSLYEDDGLLRFFAFWRWGPDRAFRRAGNYWVLREPTGEARPSDVDQPIGVLDRPWFQQLIGLGKRVLRRFNDSTAERLASGYLKKIPDWNYRVAVFNALVQVLEDLESATPKLACDRAAVFRGAIAREKPQAKASSIVTGAVLAACSLVSWVASLFQDEVKETIRSLLAG